MPAACRAGPAHGEAGQQQGGSAGALVNIVAGMLANSGPGGAGGSAAGGLGGLAGLAEQFQRGSLGDVMNSWIGTGQNQPISPDQLGNVLGGDLLGQLTDAANGHGPRRPARAVVANAAADGRSAHARRQAPSGGLGDIGAILGRFAQAR